jgi:hypothetical protein
LPPPAIIAHDSWSADTCAGLSAAAEALAARVIAARAALNTSKPLICQEAIVSSLADDRVRSSVEHAVAGITWCCLSAKPSRMHV